MDPRPAERKAVLFSAGDVRFALRVSHLREIAACSPDRAPGGRASEHPEVTIRGASVPAVPVATVLGLEPASAGGYALLTESTPPLALRVDALHGILDLAEAEVFQLPSRTPLPQPPPFRAAVVSRGAVALELEVSALGWAPIPPADAADPPPPIGAASDRELCFARSGRTYAVPLSLVVQVLDSPRIWSIPLTPRAHVGVVYHGRAIHPVFDLAALYGSAGDAVDPLARRGEALETTVLLLDAGGAPLAVVADRVLAAGEMAPAPEVVRPPWDALFC